MEAKKRPIKNSFFLVLLCSLSFLACDENRVYDSYSAIPNNEWRRIDPIVLPFVINDTLTKNSLFVLVRNNNKFKFNKLVLITELLDPNGKNIVDTLVCDIADASGKLLGKGFTEIKEHKILYKKNHAFPLSGDYILSVRQGVTNDQNALDGIVDLGFRIEKEN
uniref:gliding motility lipoprotein GldH n=1 Tax=Polaribacter sp. TaxID=1920175 RepID=UPI0040484504